jgi:hypothetical protein
VIRHAECARQRLQAFEVGPGTDNDVRGRRMVGENRRHRFNDGIDPFPSYEPSDREQQAGHQQRHRVATRRRPQRPA